MSAETRQASAPVLFWRSASSAPWLICLALLAAGCDHCGAIVCGLGNEDSDLVGEERAVGELSVGDGEGRVSFVAHLTGRYRRVRGGGGRGSYTCVTDDEVWRVAIVGAAMSPPGVETVALSSTGWSTVEGRSAATAVLHALEVEQCAGPSADVTVYRIAGLGTEHASWQVAYSVPGRHIVTGPLQVTLSEAEDSALPDEATCAQASRRAMPWSQYARLVYSWSALEQRGVQASSRARRGALAVERPPSSSLEHRFGKDVCHVLWATGSEEGTQHAFRCWFALEEGAGDEVRAAIAEGEAHSPDAEALLYAVLDDLAVTGPRLAPNTAPSVVHAATIERLPEVASSYLAASSTVLRQRRFTDAILQTEETPPAWRLRIAATLAARLDEAERCDLVLQRAATLATRASARDPRDDAHGIQLSRKVLALVQPTLSCGDDEVRRAVMHQALALTTRTETAGLPCSRRSFDNDPTGGTQCRSLPVVAGEWLARRCADDTIRVALEVARAHPPEHSEARMSPIFDGATRVLEACDRESLVAVIDALPQEVRGGWRRHLGIEPPPPPASANPADVGTGTNVGETPHRPAPSEPAPVP